MYYVSDILVIMYIGNDIDSVIKDAIFHVKYVYYLYIIIILLSIYLKL